MPDLERLGILEEIEAAKDRAQEAIIDGCEKALGETALLDAWVAALDTEEPLAKQEEDGERVTADVDKLLEGGVDPFAAFDDPEASLEDSVAQFQALAEDEKISALVNAATLRR